MGGGSPAWGGGGGGGGGGSPAWGGGGGGGSPAWGVGAQHGGWEPSMGGGSPAWGGVASIDIRPSQIMLGNLAKFLFSDSLIRLIYCTHYSNIILFHRSSPIFFKLS